MSSDYSAENFTQHAQCLVHLLGKFLEIFNFHLTIYTQMVKNT